MTETRKAFPLILHAMRRHRWIIAGLAGATMVAVSQSAGASLSEAVASGILAYAGYLLLLTPPVPPLIIQGVSWTSYAAAVMATRNASELLSTMAIGGLETSLRSIALDLARMADAFERDPEDAGRNYTFTSTTLPRLIALAQQAFSLQQAAMDGRLETNGQVALDASIKTLARARDAVSDVLIGLQSDDVARLRRADAIFNASLTTHGFGTS